MSKGIDNIKKIVSAVAEFGNITGKVLEDGKVNLADISALTTLPGAVMNFYSAVTNFTELKEEFADLSKEEITELEEYFKTQFDIPQDGVEETIEKVAESLDVVWTTFQTIAKVASIFKK
jgi:hypothetical protein